MFSFKKKFVVIFLLFTILCCLTVSVFADDVGEYITIQSVVNNNTLNNNTNNSTNNTVSNTANNTVNNVTELAKTGESSTAVLLVAIFAVSSIYAYKKIREYNV